MKNNLYPQTNQAFDRSFDDYDSVIGNEFSVNSSANKSGGASNHSDDMSSLGNSQLGPSSAANSPVRMNRTSAAAASANPQQWRQQRVPMTPMSSGSSDSEGLRVGDVSLILGDNGRVNNSAADIESMGGDSLFMMSPPVRQAANLERDAAAWNPAPTHKYDTGTSKYLQLGPLGDELSFGGQDPTNSNHHTFTNEGEIDIDSEEDCDDEIRSVYFLPQGRFGQCVVIGSTILVVGALIISVVAILNLNAVMNNQNDSSKLNIEAVGGGGVNNDVIFTTFAPTEPPSTLAPIVPPTTSSPTNEPTHATDPPTAAPLKSTGSPIVQEVSTDTDSPETSISTLAPSKEPTTDEPTLSPTSSEPTEVPTSEEPTNSPSAATPSPTSGVPTKEPTSEEPTPAPSKVLANFEPSLGETEAPVITTTSPSKAPITEEPTISFEPTLSPTKQSLLTAGSDAYDVKDTHFYLVSDSLYVRQEWKKNFGKLSNGRAKFMIHVGSATPLSEDCPEEAFTRTETSLSFSPLVAFSLPGNNDYTVSCLTACADFFLCCTLRRSLTFVCIQFIP